MWNLLVDPNNILGLHQDNPEQKPPPKGPHRAWLAWRGVASAVAVLIYGMAEDDIGLPRAGLLALGIVLVGWALVDIVIWRELILDSVRRRNIFGLAFLGSMLLVGITALVATQLL